MKFFISALLLSLGLVGCSSVLSNNGPNNVIEPSPHTEPGTGKVAYNPDGLPQLVTVRRTDAIDKVKIICGNRGYKIEKEEEVTPQTINGGISMIGANRAHVIHFSCNK